MQLTRPASDALGAVSATAKNCAGAEPFPELVIGEFVQGLQPTFRWAAAGVGWITLLCFLYLGVAQFDYALPFGLIAGSAWALMAFTLRDNRGGLPIVSVLAMQHALTYGLPLVVQNPTIKSYSPECLLPASSAFVVFIASMGLGWRTGKQRRVAAPSKYFIAGRRSSTMLSGHLGQIGLGLLCFGTASQLLLFTGLYSRLAGDFANQFFSAFQSIGLVASASGALLAAFASKRNRNITGIFWSLWIANFVLQISGVLLSGATSLVLATIAGLFLGGRRIPWIPATAILCALAFLNLGKFDVRARYWSEAGKTSTVGLQGLPAFYGQWFAASFSKLTSDSAPVALGLDAGQSLTNRIDNLQNLLFVTDRLVLEKREPLAGQGYSSLPSVFIPRLFWKDKPRTHEGQAALNLHFGRQGSVEETERTYVAWGLLPEAMGNFGMWIGPCALGLLLGWVGGWIEAWSVKKNLLSIEGLSASMLLVFAAVSFEMSMGVLVAMLFQSAITIVAGGLILRSVMAR